jgi:hypothetical protein
MTSLSGWNDAEPTWDAPSMPSGKPLEYLRHSSGSSGSVARQEAGRNASLNSWGDDDIATPWDDPHTAQYSLDPNSQGAHSADLWEDVKIPVEEHGGNSEGMHLAAEYCKNHRNASWSGSSHAQTNSWVSNDEESTRAAAPYITPPDIAPLSEFIQGGMHSRLHLPILTYSFRRDAARFISEN